LTFSKAKAAFETAHAAALGKTVATVALSDEAEVDAALAAWETLGAGVKTLLSGEKALLNSLKTRIAQLKPQPPARVTGLSSSPGMRAVDLKWYAAARAETYEVYWTCSITRLVIEQVQAKCSAFCRF
jgi:hypothetical protein